jgi:hypothetical protein
MTYVFYTVAAILVLLYLYDLYRRFTRNERTEEAEPAWFEILEWIPSIRRRLKKDDHDLDSDGPDIDLD